MEGIMTPSVSNMTIKFAQTICVKKAIRYSASKMKR